MEQYDSVNYYEKIKEDKLTLVKYAAKWCGPCKVLSPIIEQVISEHPEINAGEVDIDTHMELAVNDGIRGVPTVVFYKNGEVVDKVVGLQSAAVYDAKINALLSN